MACGLDFAAAECRGLGRHISTSNPHPILAPALYTAELNYGSDCPARAAELCEASLT